MGLAAHTRASCGINPGAWGARLMELVNGKEPISEKGRLAHAAWLEYRERRVELRQPDEHALVAHVERHGGESSGGDRGSGEVCRVVLDDGHVVRRVEEDGDRGHLMRRTKKSGVARNR
eukprot:scaffold2313_cov100-Isochrysis_galbana.AAC.6